MLTIARNILRKFGIEIVRESTLRRLVAAERRFVGQCGDAAFLATMPAQYTHRLLELLPKSKAQLRQDLFVLAATEFKSGGYFVEFGATDGLGLSNTWLLESEFAWSGILAEPGRRWHSDLRSNRRALIDTRCVWSASGKNLSFNETQVGEYSTVQEFSDSDLHAAARQVGDVYDVESISLTDLLLAHSAPTTIDYLSIDTEGSEFEILRAFDWGRYRFRVITCEHNHTRSRKDIFDLLSRNGYKRVFEEVSEFDDWYVSINT